MTVDEARRHLLTQPGALEGEHHGHPDVRVGGRIFATLWPMKGHAVLRLPAEVAAALEAEHGGSCRVVSRTAAAWWTKFELSQWSGKDFLPYVEIARHVLPKK